MARFIFKKLMIRKRLEQHSLEVLFEIAKILSVDVKELLISEPKYK